MPINTIKHLELSLDETESIECQLTTAVLTDEPEGAETLTTFCGSQDLAGTPKYVFNISGFLDYGEAESVFDLLHTAYIAEPQVPIACVLTVGSKTRTFDAVPSNDPPFGGDAGAAMTGDVTLNVVSEVTDGTATP